MSLYFASADNCQIVTTSGNDEILCTGSVNLSVPAIVQPIDPMSVSELASLTTMIITAFALAFVFKLLKDFMLNR